MMQVFLQKNCLLCDTASNRDFCEPCYHSLPQLPADRCSNCLLPITASRRCGACLAKPPAFTRAIAALRYAFPVDALIHALKYRTNLAITPVLAELLIEQLALSTPPDFIVPMPLHPARLKERGFNQAVEISRHIAKQYQITLLYDACKRIRDTPSQTGLTWKARKKNIRNAFSCEMDLSGKHIAVVDDVMTTGATLNELARVLRKCGAREISSWVIARALPEIQSNALTRRFQ